MNLYGSVGNDEVNSIDYLGNAPHITLDIGKIDLGKCGAFVWEADFITKPRTDFGVVLQEINAFGFYSEYDEFGDLRAKSIRVGPETNPYFEIWDVGLGSGGKALDIFSLGVTKDALGNVTAKDGFPNTKGEFEITGWARYYSQVDWNVAVAELKNSGWSNSQEDNGTWAGGLWAGPVNPGWLNQEQEVSNLVSRTLKVKWDCCGDEENVTEITNQWPK